MSSQWFELCSMMTRSLRRHSVPWSYISLLIVTTTVMLTGLLIIQNCQCDKKTPASYHYSELVSLDSNEEQITTTASFVDLIDADMHISDKDTSPTEEDGYNDLITFMELDNSSHSTSNFSSSKYVFLSSELLSLNVSKDKDRWFRVLPEEDYLQNDTDFFVTSPEIKNTLYDNFLIKGAGICKGIEPFLLVIIPSVPKNVDLRDAIRWTWLRASEGNAWPRAFIGKKIKHIFLMGYTSTNKYGDYQQLLQESKTVGDIVMANFVDTYRNLTRKMMNGLQWVNLYCRNAEFVLKVDEDTFVNMPVMLEVIQHVSARSGSEPFVMGLEHSYHQPPVVRYGRWGVTKEEYPLDFYPKYMYGHAYILTREAVVSFISTAPNVSLVAPEDAFITGILPRFANVTRITAPSFTVCCRHIYDCEVVWNQRVALPEVKSIDRLVKLWSNIITHFCNDTSPFIG